MRLLSVETLDFEEFMGEVGNGIPSYAILSHTWDAEEVSYKDYIEQKNLSKKGYSKIRCFSELVKSEGFQYFWIDTCCIDKSSSAELSEAINSMFQWYRDADICYAYLSDVESSGDPTAEESSFVRSRWFTRGWTLQELLAPVEVVFLSSDWEEIGTKKSLGATVSAITGVSEIALDERCWPKYSVAQKMSWAAARCTTRPEDGAYCLMGLFGVNMPLLYGEGRRAFLRLQEEILKQSDDQSIFAWSYPEEEHSHTRISGLVAPSPKYFKHASQIEPLEKEVGEEYENIFEIVNHLMRIRVRLVDKVKAMRIQRLIGESHLHKIVEIQQLGETYPEPEQLAQIEHQLRAQAITIEIGDYSMRPAIQDLGASSGSMSWTPEAMGIESGLRRKDRRQSWRRSWRRSRNGSNSYDLSQEQDSVKSPGSWHWFIYEPVTVIPLKCHIGGHQLGIILSRGPVMVQGGVLSRLHNPSIVATEAVRTDQLTPFVTKYAAIGREINYNLGEALSQNCFRWPEIRIAPLLSAGYNAHENWGLGWTFDHSRAALVLKRGFRSEFEMTEYAPLALFGRISGPDANSAFFVSIPKYDENRHTCEIGVLDTHKAQSRILEYDLYSSDLVIERRVDVPLGNGQAVVVKYRAGTGASFLNLSIEALNEKKIASPRPKGTTKLATLHTNLFPTLKLWLANAPKGDWPKPGS